ncbi:uncharacterized protein LOC110893824 isoform X1 [Helianthus annuus]|uniref:uncharacterized protein LOC110893824 isoform X1 n=1 Tax=Helianthus annuus TaxID=4232 RepID=UPI000B8F6A1B|nr:uncharacterized protein LOC110893824 isoform X1 [Helianthus annuus]
MVIIYMLVNYPPTGYPPAGYPGPSASHYPGTCTQFIRMPVCSLFAAGLQLICSLFGAASNSIKGLATLIIKQWCSFNRAFTSYEIYGDYPRYLALERRFQPVKKGPQFFSGFGPPNRLSRPY